MASAKENLIVAIDTPDLDKAIELSHLLKDKVAAVKLGLEFFVANGPAGVSKIREQGVEIFLDLKFHDIPNTVASCVKQAVNLDVKFLTIHTNGGKEMMEWATREARNTMILGVTILTSTSQEQFSEIGFAGEIKDQVLKLARLAELSGLEGLVCSPLEISYLREQGVNLKLITPGIRFAEDDKGDQKRVMTPKEALEAGSDYLVMGRPITGADNILERIEYFNQSLI